MAQQVRSLSLAVDMILPIVLASKTGEQLLNLQILQIYSSKSFNPQTIAPMYLDRTSNILGKNAIR